MLPGSAGGVRGIGGSVAEPVHPQAWHGRGLGAKGSISASRCSWQPT